MKKLVVFLIIFSFSFVLCAEEKGGANIVYKYKKHQEFDFENLDVQGDPGSALGDITVSTRGQKEFRSKLPLRKNFDPEIKKALERVR